MKRRFVVFFVVMCLLFGLGVVAYAVVPPYGTGPSRLSAATPYYSIDGQLCYFEAFTAELGNATKVVNQLVRDRRMGLDFSAFPPFPSHVTDAWYKVRVPKGEGVFLWWESQNRANTPMWAVAQNRKGTWFLRASTNSEWLELGRNDVPKVSWSVHGVKVDVEIKAPAEEEILYRFSVLNEGRVVVTTPMTHKLDHMHTLKQDLVDQMVKDRVIEPGFREDAMRWDYVAHDLNSDGSDEIIAIATDVYHCRNTNCKTLIYERGEAGFIKLLDAFGAEYSILQSTHNGFYDLEVARHASRFERVPTVYEFADDKYEPVR